MEMSEEAKEKILKRKHKQKEIKTDLYQAIYQNRREEMEDYTFEKMWLDLKNGYQIYYTYVGNRYLLFKTAENCYTQKLLSDHKKNPQPKMLMLTLKRVKEMFPHMEDIEYKINM